MILVPCPLYRTECLKMLGVALIVVNLITFLAYWRDKHHARRGNWRISEGTLLFLGLIGGSPAAFLAQRVFRHKLRKGSFQLRFWLIVLLQILALFYGYYRVMDSAGAV